MSKCLRCGADSSWIQGRAPLKPRDEEIAELRDEIERLQAIVDKLPKTADGVPITFGMSLYRIIDPKEITVRVMSQKRLLRDSEFSDVWYPAEIWYSTHAAAEEARMGDGNAHQNQS